MTLKRFGLSRGRLTVIRTVGSDIHLRFSSLGLDEMLVGLEELGARSQNMQPAIEVYGDYLVNELIPEQFKRQGAPRRWAKLSPAYARWKRNRYGNLPILVLTGKMKRGFRSQARPHSLRIVNTVKRRGGKPYWIYHQFGTAKMPARPMLQLRARDRQKLREIMLAYALERQGGVR